VNSIKSKVRALKVAKKYKHVIIFTTEWFRAVRRKKNERSKPKRNNCGENESIKGIPLLTGCWCVFLTLFECE